MDSKKISKTYVPLRVYCKSKQLDISLYEYFFWDITDTSTRSMMDFVASLFQDLDIPASWEATILQQIDTQVKAYKWLLDSVSPCTERELHHFHIELWSQGLCLEDSIVWDMSTQDPIGDTISVAESLVVETGAMLTPTMQARFIAGVSWQLLLQHYQILAQRANGVFPFFMQTFDRQLTLADGVPLFVPIEDLRKALPIYTAKRIWMKELK